MTKATRRLITAEDFARLPAPADGSRQELVRGVIETMPPPGFRHGKLNFRIAKILDRHVEPNRLGHVIPETGVRTERGPDTVRGPDVAFWGAAKVSPDEEPEGYPDAVPDLCVEVLSPRQNRKKIRQKVREYLWSGVRIVWVVDPEDRAVTVYRSPEEGRLLHEGAFLSGEDVLPGFGVPIAELFGPAPRPDVGPKSSAGSRRPRGRSRQSGGGKKPASAS
jgi:Uma2 family endonuclease